jgi:hypothetical protein
VAVEGRGDQHRERHERGVEQPERAAAERQARTELHPPGDRRAGALPESRGP